MTAQLWMVNWLAGGLKLHLQINCAVMQFLYFINKNISIFIGGYYHDFIIQLLFYCMDRESQIWCLFVCFIYLLDKLFF